MQVLLYATAPVQLQSQLVPARFSSCNSKSSPADVPNTRCLCLVPLTNEHTDKQVAENSNTCTRGLNCSKLHRLGLLQDHVHTCLEGAPIRHLHHVDIEKMENLQLVPAETVYCKMKEKSNLEEQPIRQLHDVGFVDCCHTLAVVEVGKSKCILSCPPGLCLCDDLQGLNDIRHHLMLKSTVLSLCVFSAFDRMSPEMQCSSKKVIESL